MAIEKKDWLPPFTALRVWPCPTCDTGYLKENSRKRKIECDVETRFIEEYADPQYECISGRVASTLVCNNSNCQERVFSISDVNFRIDEAAPQFTLRSINYLIPVFFHPAPPIFRVHKNIPAIIAELIQEAFALYWPNASASGNLLRRAIERIMDDQGIERFPNHDRTKGALSLHARIQRFSNVNEHAAKLLMAIKWLGNTGSHGDGSQLTHEDVLEGFEFAQAAFDLLYVQSLASIIKRADEVNTRKGPRPRKSKHAT